MLPFQLDIPLDVSERFCVQVIKLKRSDVAIIYLPYHV